MSRCGLAAAKPCAKTGRWLINPIAYLTRSISEGAKSGKFEQVPVEETAILILSVINGIVRYTRPVEFPHRGTHRRWDSTGGRMSRDPGKNLRKAAVDFCRRSLMNGNMKG